MSSYETPGVYHQRADADATGVDALRTDIAGFVGIAERGPLHLAVPVESYRQFQAWFGDTIPNGYLAYCARAFFENGGRRLWAVRVASDAASPASLTMFDDRPPALAQPLWRIEASSTGSWSNTLAIRVEEQRRTQRRAVPVPNAPQRFLVGSVAGFERSSLVEFSQPGLAPVRAVVVSVDAIGGALELDRAPVGLVTTTPLRIETVAWGVQLWASGRLANAFDDISLVPGHPRYGPTLLRQPWQPPANPRDPLAEPPGAQSESAIQYFRVGRNRAAAPPAGIVIRELRDDAARAALWLPALDATAPLLPLVGGADGLAALQVFDFIGDPSTAMLADLEAARVRRGLSALDPVDELGVVAIPDIQIQPQPPATLLPPPPCTPDPCLPNAPPPAPAGVVAVGDLPPTFADDDIALVQAAQVLHCERHRDRFALLDAPHAACSDPLFGVTALRAWRQRFDSTYAALYAPWPRVVDPLRATQSRSLAGSLRSIPPCGHVAGLIAATDLRRGVFIAPANTPLQWVQGLSMSIDDARHGLLNTLGVNVLRAAPGRGISVQGARTVSSDTDWRFVNVRRLMSMIEKAIEVSIQWAVFEPNDWRTRAKLTLVAGSFLQALYDRGAMVGATPDQAFFVQCDDANNPEAARDRGELHLDIGVAPVSPFEFIVLRVGRDANGFAVHEPDALESAA